MIAVSVVVPCYNKEAYIDICMDSLLRQTLENIEIILVNDASTDGTLAILQKYESEYEQVKLIDSKVNLKQGGARNLGIRMARGKYIGFADPDDWVDETMFEKLYRLAEEHDYDMTTGYSVRVVKQLRNVALMLTDDVIIAEGMEDTTYGVYQKEFEVKPESGKVVFAVWDSIYKKEFLEKNHIEFPEHIFYEDGYFRFLADHLKQSQGFVKEVLYYYLVNDEAVSYIRNDVSVYENLLESMEELQKEIIKRGLLAQCPVEIEAYFVMRYYHALSLILARFDEPQVALLRRLSQFIVSQFPKYQENAKRKKLLDKRSKFTFEILAVNDVGPEKLYQLFEEDPNILEEVFEK